MIFKYQSLRKKEDCSSEIFSSKTCLIPLAKTIETSFWTTTLILVGLGYSLWTWTSKVFLSLPISLVYSTCLTQPWWPPSRTILIFSEKKPRKAIRLRFLCGTFEIKLSSLRPMWLALKSSFSSPARPSGTHDLTLPTSCNPFGHIQWFIELVSIIWPLCANCWILCSFPLMLAFEWKKGVPITPRQPLNTKLLPPHNFFVIELICNVNIICYSAMKQNQKFNNCSSYFICWAYDLFSLDFHVKDLSIRKI
jgi:hypothetical protein